MIFITGDIHGGIDIRKLSNRNFPAGKALTRQDYVIICGDFGLPFLPSDVLPPEEHIPSAPARDSRKEYRYWIRWLSQRPYTVLWADGNHDNHPFWAAQPTEPWMGGLVQRHPAAENVLHLLRGEYYTIEGRTFWVMGGAESHDKEYRTEGVSWWPEEIPSWREMEHGLESLAAHSHQADYIITHTMPQVLVYPALREYFPPEPTRSYLDEVYAGTKFRYWFCGHFHVDIDRPIYRLRVLYDDVISLEEFEKAHEIPAP